MGQAKQRGSFEQRKLESQQREAERMEARRRKIEATKERHRQYDLANPAQAEARRAKSRRVNTMLTTIIGATLIGRN